MPWRQLLSYTHQKTPRCSFIQGGATAVSATPVSTTVPEAADCVSGPHLAPLALSSSVSPFTPDHLPEPTSPGPAFTYCELFAGLGGFRLALDRLGGPSSVTPHYRPLPFSCSPAFPFAPLRIPLPDATGRCVFSSEIEPFARRAYTANFGDVPVRVTTLLLRVRSCHGQCAEHRTYRAPRPVI